MQVRVGESGVLVLEIITPVGSGTAKAEVLAGSRRRTVPTVKVAWLWLRGLLR